MTNCAETVRWLSVKLNAFANKYESRVNHTTGDTRTHKTSQNCIKMNYDRFSIFFASHSATHRVHVSCPHSPTTTPLCRINDLICLVLLSSENKQNRLHRSRVLARNRYTSSVKLVFDASRWIDAMYDIKLHFRRYWRARQCVWLYLCCNIR